MTLRELRKQNRMSRVYVEYKTGIKPNTLSVKENGSRAWTIEEFTALCDLYGVKQPTEVEDYARLRN